MLNFSMSLTVGVVKIYLTIDNMCYIRPEPTLYNPFLLCVMAETIHVTWFSAIYF